MKRNNVKIEYPEICVHHLFEKRVELNPDVTAVLSPRNTGDANEKLTYRELNRCANRLAHHLKSRGFGMNGEEGIVGLYMNRSPEMITAMLGILKAGLAYMPLDVSYPGERIALMMSDAAIRVVITENALLTKLSAKDVEFIRPDKDAVEIAGEPGDNPADPPDPDRLAYLLYTSGSTGAPKGIEMAHSSLVNMIWWHLETRNPKVGAKTLFWCAVSFDFSFHEIFSTLCSGGTLVAVPEEIRSVPPELAKFVAEYEIEKLFLPVTALGQLTEVENAPIPESK